MILVQLHVVKLLPASAKMLFEYLLPGKTDRQTASQTHRQTESWYPCPQEKAENGQEWVEDCFSAPDDQGNAAFAGGARRNQSRVEQP